MSIAERKHTSTRSRGFTLVELLVVISIIGVLVALTSVAVVRAISTARQTGQKTEVDQLDLAMKAYKEQFGSYPPCDLRTSGSVALARVRQHMAQRFPRYYDLSKLKADLEFAGVDPIDFRPDHALVFWLRGFNPDPTHPLLTWDGYVIENGAKKSPPEGPIKTTPLFEFDQSRLAQVKTPQPLLSSYEANNNRLYSYFPKGSQLDETGAPYVYFDAAYYAIEPTTPDPPSSKRTMFNNNGGGAIVQTFVNAGTLQQYASDLNKNGVFDTNETWINPDSFQIIAPGMDFKYGLAASMGLDRARLYPSGAGYDVSSNLADDDNVTNFAGSARIGDDKP